MKKQKKKLTPRQHQSIFRKKVYNLLDFIGTALYFYLMIVIALLILSI